MLFKFQPGVCINSIFHFNCLPASFLDHSKPKQVLFNQPIFNNTRILGTIRYYIKVLIDIPYSSSPQGIKYFTFIGPHIDCMEEKFLSPLTGQDHKVRCLRCCRRGTIALKVTLERTAYCCGENLRLKAHIENHQDFTISLCTRLYQVRFRDCFKFYLLSLSNISQLTQTPTI